MSREAKNVFFTGGWDSTFRLLYLLIVEKVPVQPVYILDPGRKSLRYELVAMSNIKKATVEQFPYTRELLRPALVRDLTELRPDAAIGEHEQEILKKYHIGSQYEWLARAAKQLELDSVEICIVKDPEKREGVFGLVYDKLVQRGGDLHVSDEYQDSPAYALFHRFTFPVINLGKIDMLRLAREHGFLDILEMSWFCHIPTCWGDPCGVCAPCRDVMKMSMGHRLPLLARINYHLSFLRVDVYGILTRNERVHRVLRRIKKAVIKPKKT